MNLQGSIDLLKLELTGVITIKNKRCLVIPIEENDIYISADPNTLKAAHAYLGVSVFERQEVSKYGQTHYIKQSLSKDYRNAHQQEAEEKRKVYLGEMKEIAFSNNNQAYTVSAPTIMPEEDDGLPF